MAGCRPPGLLDADEKPPRAARLSAAGSLIAWLLVITCGRFIPYDWYECGKPQTAFINSVQECKTSEKGEVNSGGAAPMSMNLEQFWPHARPWVESLANTFPGKVIKPQFAVWEVGHILSLIVLGGTTILMNLRLLGVGVVQEPPSEVYRNLRTWQNVGVIGIIVTGIAIGSANAERLYDSAAFIVKMLALLSGIILTYGVSRPVAAADGAVGVMQKVWFVVGSAIFLLGLWIFATSDLVNVGVYHIITAAALIVLFATRGRLLAVYLGVLIAMIVAQYVNTHILIQPDDYTHLNPVNKTWTVVFTVWILGVALFQLFRAGRGEEGGPLTKIIAYATILVWVMGAAAGRWIAFA